MFNGKINIVMKMSREVVDIMMVLYDEQEVVRSYVESEIHEATLEANIETAKRLLKMERLSIEEIAAASELSVEKVEELANELLRPFQVLCKLKN